MRGLQRPPWWPWAVRIFVLVPGPLIVAALVSDFVLGTRWLGSNPVKAGELLLGQWTMNYLVATLAVSPVRRIMEWNWLQQYRRTFGLAAFSYGLTHFLWYALVDIQLDGAQLADDLTKRTYIIVGFAALLAMLPLALTSTRAAIARLRRRWVTLHRLVYVVPVLGIVHWWMSVKADIGPPAFYSAVFALLLGWRWWHARRAGMDIALAPPRDDRSH